MPPSLPLSFLPAFLVLKRLPMPTQEPILSSPSIPASLGALAGRFFDGLEHRARTPAVSYALSLLRATLRQGAVALDSTTLFCTITGALLPPRAEPSLVIDHDGEAVPDQSEQLESFDLVSPPSISAVNGGGGNAHIDAHAWWPDFTGLDPRSQSAKFTLELEQGRMQEQEQLLVVNLSNATSPQAQIEPLDGRLQIDCDTRRSG